MFSLSGKVDPSAWVTLKDVLYFGLAGWGEEGGRGDGGFTLLRIWTLIMQLSKDIISALLFKSM